MDYPPPEPEPFVQPARRDMRRMFRFGLRNVAFSLRPGVLYAFAARARYPLVASVATQMAILISSVVLARAMGKHVFGQYGMILTIQVAFFTVSNLCLSSMLPAFISPARENPRQVSAVCGTAALLTLGFSLIGTLAFFALLKASTRICGISGLEAPTILACVPVIASVPLQYVILGEIQSMERIGHWASASAFVGIAPVAFSLLGAIWFKEMGLLGFSVFVALGGGVALYPLWVLRRRSGVPSFRLTFDKTVAGRLLLGGASLWFICVLCTFALSLARVLITRCAGHAETGCFILAYGFIGYLQMFNGAFSVPLIPNWSRLANDRRRSKLLREVRNSIAGMLLFGCGYGLLLFFLAPYIVPAIYGAQYAPAVDMVRILSFTCPLIGMGFAAWGLSISQGRVKVVFWANVLWAGALALFACILVPKHGGAGAALAVVAAYVSWGTCYVIFLIFRARQIAAWSM